MLSDAESQFAALRHGEEEEGRRLPRTLSPGELTADLHPSRDDSLQLGSVGTPEGGTLLAGSEEAARAPRGLVKKAVVSVKKRVKQLAATPREDDDDARKGRLQPHPTV